jgi:hypothetical protein
MVFELIPMLMEAMSASGGAGAAGASSAGGASGFSSLLKSLGVSSGDGANGTSSGGGILSSLMGGNDSKEQNDASQGGNNAAAIDSVTGKLSYAATPWNGPSNTAVIPGGSGSSVNNAGYLQHAIGNGANFARGGGALSSAYNVYKNGNLVEGGGDGTSDSIPANLSNHEYVFTASDVSRIGQGDTEAGARRLDEMRAAIAKDAGAKQFQPQIKHPIQYLRSAK